MNIIGNYLVQKILLESSMATFEDSGKFILRNYPQKIFDAILEYFSVHEHNEILILVDERLESNSQTNNIIKVNHEVMAQYRNENIQDTSVTLESVSYLVFITNHTIDTLNDINTLTPDDLERDFESIIETVQSELLDTDAKKKLQDVCIILLKELEGVNPFSLEKFIISILDYMNDGYPLEEAMGLSLNVLNLFTCHKCFELLKKNSRKQDIIKIVKPFKALSLALSKRVGNKTVSIEDLEERYKESDDEFTLLSQKDREVIERFIHSNSRELSESRLEFSNLDWHGHYIYRLFEKTRSRTAKPLGSETIALLEEKDTDIDESEKENLKEYDKLKAKDRESLKYILEPVYKKYKSHIEDNKSLRNKWDKFLYPSQTKSDDFILGLLETIKKLKSDSDNIDTIEVSLKYSRTTAIMKNYSRYAMNYLNKHYSVLNRISKKINFEFAFIQDIEEKLKEKKITDITQKYKKGTLSKGANELHFIIKSKDRAGNTLAERKLIWSYKATSILSGYREDIESIEKQLENNCLYANTVYRASNSEKGEKKPLTLFDYSSLESRGKNAGYRLFPTKCNDTISSKTILKSAKELFDETLFVTTHLPN